jgi:hypothetical protein
MGDVTSLLTFQTDMPHPTLGNGLFHKLELPFHFEEDKLVTLANRLNQIEIESMDSPPFFGAWCSQLGKQSGIAFVGFWPNFLYQPGTVFRIAVWMLHRNRQAVTFINDSMKNSTEATVTQQSDAPHESTPKYKRKWSDEEIEEVARQKGARVVRNSRKDITIILNPHPDLVKKLKSTQAKD